MGAACPGGQSGPDSRQAALGDEPAKRLSVVHFNDVYHMAPTSTEDPIGGVTRFATVLKQVRARFGEAVLVTFGGDFVGPSLMSTISKGAHFIEVFNELGVDFGCFGNHELDYGYQNLKDRLAGKPVDGVDYPQTATTWLSTNISESATGLPFGGEASYVKKIAMVTRAGIKIGLMGISEDWLNNCSQLQENEKRQLELQAEDFIEAGKKAAADLRRQGAQVVLCIAHSSCENDRKLAKAVPDIDFILGGHDHFYKRDRDCRLVKAGQEFRWLTHVELTLRATDSGRVVSAAGVSAVVDRYDIDEEIAEDPSMQKIVSRYTTARDEKYNAALVTSSVDLHANETYVRFKSGTLTSWLCDVLAEDFSKKRGLQSADIALCMGYRFKSDTTYPKGAFTLGNLFSVWPFDLTVIVIELTGQQIVNVLKRSARKLPSESGALYHCSSRLSYTVTLTPPDVKFNDVDVKFDGMPIDLCRTYAVAMPNDLSANGGDGYPELGAAKRIIDEEHSIIMHDVCIMWSERHKGEVIRDIADRITIIAPGTGKT